MTDQKFRDVFGSFGDVTDVKIMKTRYKLIQKQINIIIYFIISDDLYFGSDGRSRRFGFVGFRSEREARNAKDHFNNTYIDTAKIIVEFALPVSD